MEASVERKIGENLMCFSLNVRDKSQYIQLGLPMQCWLFFGFAGLVRGFLSIHMHTRSTHMPNKYLGR